jgi:hypothetical protein
MKEEQASQRRRTGWNQTEGIYETYGPNKYDQLLHNIEWEVHFESGSKVCNQIKYMVKYTENINFKLSMGMRISVAKPVQVC